jgi:hypothetical protein
LLLCFPGLCFQSSTRSSLSSANFIHEVNTMCSTSDGNNTSFPERLITPITFYTFVVLLQSHQYFLFDARVYLQSGYIVSPELIYYNIVATHRTITARSNAVHLSDNRSLKSKSRGRVNWSQHLHTEQCPEAPSRRFAVASVASDQQCLPART